MILTKFWRWVSVAAYATGCTSNSAPESASNADETPPARELAPSAMRPPTTTRANEGSTLPTPLESVSGRPVALSSGVDAGAYPEPDAGCAAPASLAVMAFNLRFDSGGPNSLVDVNGWLLPENPRRERVLSVLSEQSPDLVGMQEVLSNQVDDLIQALDDYEFFGVGRDDGARAGEFAGMLYRRERFERLEGGHFWLSETPDIPGTVFPGSGSTRMASWLRLRDRSAGQSFLWLNTHWDNASASSREQSASLIREQLPLLADTLPILVTGDLNATETSTPVRTLIAGPPALIDGYRQAIPNAAPEELTFHGFQGTILGSRIDFILHGAEFVTRDAAIVRTSFQGRYPSDHYPVIATLDWAESPCDGADAGAR